MTSISDHARSFREQLDTLQGEHDRQTEQWIAEERERALQAVSAALPEDIAGRLAARGAALPGAAVPTAPAIGAVRLTGEPALQEIDQAFLRQFDLGAYYPASRLNYPTVYCETAEEFYSTLLLDLPLSPVSRERELKRLVEEAGEAIKQGGGAIFGVNIPGKGCYINGWVFGLLEQAPPAAVLADPAGLVAVLATAAHEKLGHGFLERYSTLGAAKTRLGLTLLQTASQFGIQPADDALSGLRRRQANVVFGASRLVEEGWASWIEGQAVQWLGAKRASPVTLEQVAAAAQNLPAGLEQREAFSRGLLGALQILFVEPRVDGLALRDAVLAVAIIDDALAGQILPPLRQPLRYCVGELLMNQIAQRCGERCAPYAALIAANVNLNLETVGLTDLQELLVRDPRLNPDMRLAAISRIEPGEPNNPRALARAAQDLINFSAPEEIR